MTSERCRSDQSGSLNVVTLPWPRVLVPEATAGLPGFCDTICGRWENLILDLMRRLARSPLAAHVVGHVLVVDSGTPAVIRRLLPQSGSASRAEAVPTGSRTLPCQLQVFLSSSSALLQPYLPRPLYYSSSFIPAVISSSRRRFRSDPTELHRLSVQWNVADVAVISSSPRTRQPEPR